VKKINRLKDPFLRCTIIDVLGILGILTIIIFENYPYEHPFISALISIPLVLLVLFRAMWTSVSMSMIKQLMVLRLVLSNINIEIKISKTAAVIFGDMNPFLYKKKLLIEKKKKAKAVYLRVVELIAFLWKRGYNPDALLFVLSALLSISDDIERLCTGYDGK
jgi:hypothetical protein